MSHPVSGLCWSIYLHLTARASRLGERLARLRAQPERGDLNIATAIWAAIAVTLATLIAAAITAAVKTNIAKIH